MRRVNRCAENSSEGRRFARGSRRWDAARRNTAPSKPPSSRVQFSARPRYRRCRFAHRNSHPVATATPHESACSTPVCSEHHTDKPLNSNCLYKNASTEEPATTVPYGRCLTFSVFVFLSAHLCVVVEVAERARVPSSNRNCHLGPSVGGLATQIFNRQAAKLARRGEFPIFFQPVAFMRSWPFHAQHSLKTAQPAQQAEPSELSTVDRVDTSLFSKIYLV